MNKQEFLTQLEYGLKGLPKEDVDERVVFYGEMIDDLTDEGMSEEEAVGKIGRVEDVVSQIVSDNRFQKQQAGETKKRRLCVWEMVLLIIGSPVWLALVVSAVAVMLALYVSWWAVLVSLWASFGAFIGSAAGGIISGVGMICNGEPLSGIALIGMSLVLTGFGIFLFFGCKALTKGTVTLTKRTFLWLKNRFSKKEGAK